MIYHLNLFRLTASRKTAYSVPRRRLPRVIIFQRFLPFLNNLIAISKLTGTTFIGLAPTFSLCLVALGPRVTMTPGALPLTFIGGVDASGGHVYGGVLVEWVRIVLAGHSQNLVRGKNLALFIGWFVLMKLLSILWLFYVDALGHILHGRLIRHLHNHRWLSIFKRTELVQVRLLSVEDLLFQPRLRWQIEISRIKF